MASRRSLIINLEPLKEDDSVALAEKVVRIHAMAWDWPADEVMTHEIVLSYWMRYAEMKPEGPIRPFLRTLIDLLDVAQQSNGSFDLDTVITGLTFGEE
jgi:hypothetical protein